MRNSFVFYGSWWEAIKNLPRDVQGDVLTAIIEYGLTGVTTGQLKPIAKAMLAMAKTQIDINNQRFENGKKGGRKKTGSNQTETKPKPSSNQTETKPKPNVNDNDNDIKEISLSRDKEIPRLEKDIKMPLDECHAYILKNYSQWTETVTMNIRSSGFPDFTMDSFKDYLRRFFEKLKNEGEDGKSPSDAQSHFYRWLVIQLGNAPKNAYLSENNRLLEWLPDGMYKRFVGMVHDFAPYCFANMKMPSEEEVDGFKHMFESTKTIMEALMQVENNTELRRKREYLGQTIRDQLAITKKINT